MLVQCHKDDPKLSPPLCKWPVSCSSLFLSLCFLLTPNYKSSWSYTLLWVSLDPWNQWHKWLWSLALSICEYNSNNTTFPICVWQFEVVPVFHHKYWTRLYFLWILSLKLFSKPQGLKGMTGIYCSSFIFNHYIHHEREWLILHAL